MDHMVLFLSAGYNQTHATARGGKKPQMLSVSFGKSVASPHQPCLILTQQGHRSTQAQSSNNC